MDETADHFWINPAQSRDELEGKTVQYELTAGNLSVSGLGFFRQTGGRTDGKRRVEIVSPVKIETWKMQDNIIVLRQIHAEAIAAHPDRSVADFLLVFPPHG